MLIEDGVLNAVKDPYGTIYTVRDSLWCNYLDRATIHEIVEAAKLIDPNFFVTKLPIVNDNDLTEIEYNLDILIPKEQFLSLTGIFLLYAEDRLEVGALGLYRESDRDWQYLIPKHKVTNSVNVQSGSNTETWPYVTLQGEETTLRDMYASGYVIASQEHSHHYMSPTPSAQDDIDEIKSSKGIRLCRIFGSVNHSKGVWSWKNNFTLATPWTRYTGLKEQDYVEPYQHHEALEYFPKTKEDLPPKIVEFIEAGIPKYKSFYAGGHSNISTLLNDEYEEVWVRNEKQSKIPPEFNPSDYTRSQLLDISSLIIKELRKRL
jgi:hypothetical protein